LIGLDPWSEKSRVTPGAREIYIGGKGKIQLRENDFDPLKLSKSPLPLRFPTRNLASSFLFFFGFQFIISNHAHGEREREREE
jgi:hypothetical protein